MKNSNEQLGQKLTAKDYSGLLKALNETALVSMTDDKGNIIYANEKFVQVAKYSLDELVGQNHRILKSGHQPDAMFVELWNTISSGKLWRGEIKNRAKDGSYYWVDTSIAPVLNQVGKPERYIAVRFLITERKLKEEDYAGSLKALNETALVSMTDDKGNIIYANEKFVQVAKYSLDELVGQNHRILKSGHQPDAMFVELWNTISSGKLWRGEIKNRAKDGSYYWVDTSIAPVLNQVGKPERYIAVRFLITERKKLEEEIQKQVQGLEDMNKVMVGRELRMIELKEQIRELGKKPKKS